MAATVGCDDGHAGPGAGWTTAAPDGRGSLTAIRIGATVPPADNLVGGSDAEFRRLVHGRPAGVGGSPPDGTRRAERVQPRLAVGQPRPVAGGLPDLHPDGGRHGPDPHR